MGVIYVARSAAFGTWASDVGLSKHVFKVGWIADPEATPLKAVIEAGWAGETDWKLIKSQDAEDLTEDLIVERLSRREKMIDPTYYPRLKGTAGLFKVAPLHVHNHLIIQSVMADGTDKSSVKVKPVDFATYLIHNALR
jgi:hypothetical protein